MLCPATGSLCLRLLVTSIPVLITALLATETLLALPDEDSAALFTLAEFQDKAGVVYGLL